MRNRTKSRRTKTRITKRKSRITKRKSRRTKSRKRYSISNKYQLQGGTAAGFTGAQEDIGFGASPNYYSSSMTDQQIEEYEEARLLYIFGPIFTGLIMGMIYKLSKDYWPQALQNLWGMWESAGLPSGDTLDASYLINTTVMNTLYKWGKILALQGV
jgi:hypothetical protein